MTPQEKAESLLESMYSANQPYTFEPKAAKMCAMAAVNEIIDHVGQVEPFLGCTYWIEVKQEIKKL